MLKKGISKSVTVRRPPTMRFHSGCIVTMVTPTLLWDFSLRAGLEFSLEDMMSISLKFRFYSLSQWV